MLLTLIAMVGQPCLAAEPAPTFSFAPLFDGKSFAGWEGNLEMFRVEDGAIDAGTLQRPIPRNEYLCTLKTYRDFELRLRFKLLGENPNAGVQFRSQRVPGASEMVGYQADMGGAFWGCLYDERRHKLLAGPTEEEQKKLIRADGWNDYVIRAEGPQVQLWLNGHKTVDYTEPDASIPQEGVFGLQIHKRGPTEAWYRDLLIRPLSGNSAGSPPLPAKPNILVILADDLGYGELGCQGFTNDIPTPHIDSIAKNGVRFTSGYVSGPYCSPTRAGLMTGRYQNRFGHEFNGGNPRLKSAAAEGLAVTETTLGDRMRAAGYTTAFIGKSHLGYSPQFHPLRRGFDEFFGMLGAGHDWPATQKLVHVL